MERITEDILFQNDQMKVTDRRIISPLAIIFYSDISDMSINEGKPFQFIAAAGIVAMIPVSFTLFYLDQMIMNPGSHALVLLLMTPMVAAIILGFTYRAKYLYLRVNGAKVAIFKSKSDIKLRDAYRAIEKGRKACAKITNEEFSASEDE